jgi:hypothetical protein
MARSPSCFNLYWGWLLIFLGSHESQVADPMIEAINRDKHLTLRQLPLYDLLSKVCDKAVMPRGGPTSHVNGGPRGGNFQGSRVRFSLDNTLPGSYKREKSTGPAGSGVETQW